MTGLSLFSGMDIAAKVAGINIVAFIGEDDFCRPVLREHWAGIPTFEDVKTLRCEDVEAVDVVYGGWPCQPFSDCGERRAFQDDRNLCLHFMRIMG